MPDNNEVHEGMSEAISSLEFLFSESITRGEENDMTITLRETGIYYFRNPSDAGADYCQVTTCDEPDCLLDRN